MVPDIPGEMESLESNNWHNILVGLHGIGGISFFHVNGA